VNGEPLSTVITANSSHREKAESLILSTDTRRKTKVNRTQSKKETSPKNRTR
jgi:predicted ATP-grasp superfamily ATP-dependent carboligase